MIMIIVVVILEGFIITTVSQNPISTMFVFKISCILRNLQCLRSLFFIF